MPNTKGRNKHYLYEVCSMTSTYEVGLKISEAVGVVELLSLYRAAQRSKDNTERHMAQIPMTAAL